MNFSLFTRKLKVISDNAEDEFIDLLSKTIEIPYEPEARDLLHDSYEVTQYEEQRPDLICYNFYGTTDNIDYILKLNGISNPYYIYKGLILKIPSEGFIKKMTKDPKVYEDKKQVTLKRGTVVNINRQFQTPKNDKGKKRLEYLKKKYKKSEFLPPSLRSFEEADKNSNKSAKDRISIRETLKVNNSIRKTP